MGNHEQSAEAPSSSAAEPVESGQPMTRFELESLRSIGPDWYLQFLVGLVTDPENESVRIPLTLHVGGLMVSGELASGALFFDHMFEQMKERYSDSAREETREIYASWSDSYRKAPTDIVGPHYIHLCNAQVWDSAGNRIPSKDGVWWRGRLASVDGFVLGSIQTRSDSVPES